MKMVTAATMLVVLGIAGGAVAVAHGAEFEPEKVGVCHATGAEEHPYVYIVVDASAVTTGHEGDVVGVSSPDECPGPSAQSMESPEGSCVGDMSAEQEESAGVPAAAEPAAAEAEDAESSDAPDSTDAEDEAAPTDEDETESTDEASEDANASVPEATSTESDNATDATLCAADLSIVSAGALQGAVLSFDFLVTSLGPEEVNEAWLNVSLPDVGKDWTMTSSDPQACALDGRTILCDFDDLIIGETRTVQATAPRCPEDCGEDIDATGLAGAFNDGDASNNEAPVTVVIPDCGVTAPAPSEEPANETSEPEENATEPPANDTEANGTQEAAPPVAPETADVRLVQLSQQDDEQVTLVLRVVNRGPGLAEDVVLSDALPDVRRAWFLGGDDASDCTLDGRELACDFGDLEDGAERLVMLRAYTDRLPCGEHKVNTATLETANDDVEGNNRSSAGITARAC
ncbi:MAG: hypothetical protein HYT80_09175 [Euryarchaeota archaeon]|nr:hypothetical protein [Euryarchaeota archaeon]